MAKHWLECLDAHGMMKVWGLRTAGSDMKDLLKESGGDAAGTDDELDLVIYVEATQGFFAAKPVLSHVYVHFRPVESYRHFLPGCNIPRPNGKLGQVMLDNFLKELNRRLIDKPFRISEQLEETVPFPKEA